jgi:2-polyprenyl-3-methyl-5-hydroxy-6-metoxy-1,4-benzoquinol methylase
LVGKKVTTFTRKKAQVPQESFAAEKPGGPKQVDYVLGTSDRERQRLIRQAKHVHDMTLDTFRWAGISPGMRVLDIGCGVGDVAMLAANLVGPVGSVVAIDRDPDNLAFAAQRAAQAGLRTIAFRAADINEFADAPPFDAIVGRYILLFLPDRVASLRNLLRSLRRGGIVAMLEPDFTLPFRSVPPAPLFTKVTEWLRAVTVAANINIDSGPALLRIFREAGLTGTNMDCRQWVGGGRGYDMYGLVAETVRSMLPAMEKHGITTAAELDVDTLEARLEAEAVALGSLLFFYRNFSAWATKP